MTDWPWFDCGYKPVSAHTFIYDMASKQKERFELLFDSLKAATHYISEMDKRLSWLKVIEMSNVIREELEKNIERCRDSLVLDIDTDFSYDEIVSDNRWRYSNDETLVVPNENRSSFTKLKRDVFNNDYFDLVFSDIIREIKEFEDSLYKKNLDVWKSHGGDDEHKPVYTSSLDVDVLKGIFTHVSSIHKITDDALFKILLHSLKVLKMRISELNDILKEHPSKQKCINLYNQHTSGMGVMSLKSKAGELYNEWIKHRADSDVEDIDKDLLNDYKEDTVVEILKLRYISNVQSHNSRSYEKEHKNDIDFESMGCDVSKMQKMYCSKFLSLFETKRRGKRIEYMPQAHRIGEYMFLNRSKYSVEQRNEFLVQLFLLLRIQKELFANSDEHRETILPEITAASLNENDKRIKNAIEYIISIDIIKHNHDYAMIMMILQQGMNMTFKNGQSFVDYLKCLEITYKRPSASSINKIIRDARNEHPKWIWIGLDQTEIKRRNDVATFFLNAYNKNN